jgi:hypothetical protein
MENVFLSRTKMLTILITQRRFSRVLRCTLRHTWSRLFASGSSMSTPLAVAISEKEWLSTVGIVLPTCRVLPENSRARRLVNRREHWNEIPCNGVRGCLSVASLPWMIGGCFLRWDRIALPRGAALIPSSGSSSGSQVSKLQEELWAVPPTEGA